MARGILKYLKISVNCSENLVYIKTGLHRRLHTHKYYGWVNKVVVSTFLSSEHDYEVQRQNMLSVLEKMGKTLERVSGYAPY